VCPKCGGVDVELTAGEELMLESIEYEGTQGTARQG
jgi:Zn finger protein HypA/HybF involved in hydrogenase expression